MTNDELITKITELLDEKKAENIECFNMENTDYITNHVIIATALAGKHSYALLDYLKTSLKSQGIKFWAVDELSEDWVIIDLGEIMIHIFTQNHRDKFNLEELFTNFARKI